MIVLIILIEHENRIIQFIRHKSLLYFNYISQPDATESISPYHTHLGFQISVADLLIFWQVQNPNGSVETLDALDTSLLVFLLARDNSNHSIGIRYLQA